MEEGLPGFTESFGDRRCRFTLHAVLVQMRCHQMDSESGHDN
jgi:hypothetical protein